jgi:hypothetical protein
MVIFEVLGAPGQSGNVPFSWFSDRSRNFNFSNSNREHGMVPENEFLKSIRCPSAGAPISDGNTPDRLFIERSK